MIDDRNPCLEETGGGAGGGASYRPPAARVLIERWPRTSALPHIALGSFPTAVEPLEKLSSAIEAEVWIKRDDRSGSPGALGSLAPIVSYGGNKLRKLEYLLGHARAEGADTILTTGAVGSNHVLATSIYGVALGFDVHAVLMPQLRTARVEANVRSDLAAGAVLHPVSGYALVPPAMAAIAAKLKLHHKRVFVIGPGGSDATGVLGYVEAGLELGDQLNRGELPEPDAIYLALGTGGTAAGLAVGLAAAGVMATVVGVRVTPRKLVSKTVLGALARGAVARLRVHDNRFPSVAEVALRNIVIEEGFLGEGYGIATPEARDAIGLAEDTEGLAVDSTYTGKALSALIAHARGARKGQRLMFLHTLNSAPLERMLAAAPPLPERVRALMIV